MCHFIWQMNIQNYLDMMTDTLVEEQKEFEGY